MPGTLDIYVRVSRMGNREEASQDEQEQSCRALVERKGFKTGQVVIETNVSGGKDSTKREVEKLIKRIETKESAGIAVYDFSRLTREDAFAAGMLVGRIHLSGGIVYGATDNYDSSAPGAAILTAAYAEQANAYLKVARSRSGAGVERAIAQGKYIAARIPFGYVRDAETRKLVIDSRTAPLVKEIFERRAKGESFSTISRWLFETHKIDKPKQTIATMVKNVAYLGYARQGKMVNEAAHDPIVSRLLFDRANAVKGKRPIWTGDSKDLMLRGLVTCASCGSNLYASSRRGKRINGGRESILVYKCSYRHCTDHAYVIAPDLDAYVSESILNLFSRADLRDSKTTAADFDSAEKELAEAEYALEQFKGNKKAITILGLDQWNELLAEYVTMRNAAQTNLDALKEAAEISYEGIRKLWNEWTNESRIEFLGKVIRGCEIAPAHGTPIASQDRISLTVTTGEIFPQMPQDRITFLPLDGSITIERD